NALAARQIVIADVEDAAHGGMRDLARELDFAPEPLERAGIIDDVGAHGLERDAFLELEIVGFVDLAHPALRDEADDAPPLRHQIAWGEGGRDGARQGKTRPRGGDGHAQRGDAARLGIVELDRPRLPLVTRPCHAAPLHYDMRSPPMYL